MKHISDLAKQFQVPNPNQPDTTPEPVCEYCEGKGMYLAVQKSSGKSRMKMCPYCEKGRGLALQIRENGIKKSGLPHHYIDANLKEWGSQLSQSDVASKLIAYWATIEFAVNKKVSSHGIANRAIEHYQTLGQPIPATIQQKLEASDQTLPGLVLYGDYGVGKTWLGAAATNHLLERANDVLYMRMADMMAMLMDTWRSSEQTMDVLNKFRQADILFIDDMNAKTLDETPLAPHLQEYASMLIRYRMANHLPTLITTNLYPNLFRIKWSDEATAVLMENAHWVKVGGVQLRNQATNWE